MHYQLEQLLSDHEPMLAMESIAPFIAHFDPTGSTVRPIVFTISPGSGQSVSPTIIEIDWDEKILTSAMHPYVNLPYELLRWRGNKSLSVERKTEIIGYGLAMIATACILNRRIENFNLNKITPDLLFDLTAKAPFSGVEAAARGKGAFGTLVGIAIGQKDTKTNIINYKDGKRFKLRNSSLVFEAYLSLWSTGNHIGYWESSKP